MAGIPVISFAGYSGSGKTTLIERLIPVLRERGLRVAVIKHDGHGFDIDHEGRDSWRFTNAGAQLSVVTSEEKTAAVQQGGVPLEGLLAAIKNVDLIIVEGYKGSSLPQIGVARRACGKGFTADMGRFMAVVTDMDVEKGLPIRRFGLEDIEGIAEFIMEKTMKASGDFTHFNDEGRAKMVNVGEKLPSCRTALAAGRVLVNRDTYSLISSGGVKKGDVLTVAQIAGIMGAKRTPDIIPMCHPVIIDGIDLSLSLNEELCAVEIQAEVACTGRTGVEMEALMAVATAALTVYDMCKAVQKDIVITDIRLISKTGGVHGDFNREEGI